LLIEVERHDEQQLLESVVQRPCDLLARVVLGKRQVPRHLAQLRRPVLQFRRALLQRRLGALAFGNVGDECDRAPTTDGRHVIETHFDRKRRAIPAFADQLQAVSHQPRTRRRKVFEPVLDVSVADQRRNQSFDRLADQRIRSPAEHGFKGSIRHHDHALGVD